MELIVRMCVRQRYVLACEMEKWRTFALVSVLLNVVVIAFLVGGAM